MNESEIEFLMFMQCWVYPFCYVPPDPKNCLRIESSGRRCEDCRFKVESEEKARNLYRLYERQITIKEAHHYAFVNSDRWKKTIRPQILEYDNFTCKICGNRNEKELHVHHIMDFSGDSDLSPKNLVTLCNKCHMKLHPIFPAGMWSLGWPDLEKVRSELKIFYNKVRESTERNKNRFKLPLEHIMMHICLICSLRDICDIGKDTTQYIADTMKQYDLIDIIEHRYSVAELRDGIRHATVEGVIVAIIKRKEVETKYGKTTLVVAVLKDDSGDIPVNLFGEQIDKVKVGDRVRVEKGYTSIYEGKLTLNVPKKRGKIIVNPPNSIPFPSRKIGRRYRKLELICGICGSKFRYDYKGGPVRKCCEKCREKRKVAKKLSKVTINCSKCGAKFVYEYRGGPLRKYCDPCLKISKTSNEKELLALKISEMYSKGIRPYLIAQTLGMKRNTLNYWLNKLFPDRQKWKRRYA